MKKLDMYLLRHFFAALLVVSIAVGLTILVINMIEQLPHFVDNNIPGMQIVEYYIYFAGWVLKTFLPMFVMLAVLFSISMLARRLELLAMRASGLSLFRIVWPIIATTLLISVAHFGYNEYLFPPANKKRVMMKEFTIENRSKRAHAIVRNIYRQISPGYFYTIGKYNAEKKTGDDLKVYKTTRNRLTEILIAKSIRYEDFRWIARDVIIRFFEDSLKERFIQVDSMTLVDISEKPADLAKRIGKPEDMGIDELRDYIEVMKRTGGPYLRESIDLKIKYAFPFTSFVVTLICIPFAANPRRGGMAVSFAVGALLALAYFVLFRVSQSAGYNEKIPQELAAWGINGIFLIIGLVAMFRARSK